MSYAPPPPPPAGASSRFPAWLAALAGAAVVAVITVVVVLVAAGGDESDTTTSAAALTTSTTAAVTTTTPTTTVATTTEATTTTTSTTTTTLPPAPVWSRVDDDPVLGGAGDQGMLDVVAVGSAVLAVGYDYSGGDGDAALWTSEDGVTWARVPHQEAALGGAGDQEMDGVAVGGTGLVAVGGEWLGDEADAVVWTSPDGLAWNRVPHDETVFGGAANQLMTDVVAAGPGLVGVGYDASGGDRDAAVWTSADGLAWSRVPHDEAVFGGGASQGIEVVLVAGARLVGVGYDGSGGDFDAAVWTSVDGLAWSRVPHDEVVLGGEGDQEMWDAVVSGGGVVAVGYEDLSATGDGRAAVWVSADGVAWSRVPHDEAVLGGEGWQEMAAVIVAEQGLLAVGNDDSTGDWDAVAWESPDGLAWTRVPYDRAVFGGTRDQFMWSAAAFGADVVVVGEIGRDDVWNAVTWLRRASG